MSQCPTVLQFTSHVTTVGDPNLGEREQPLMIIESLRLDKTFKIIESPEVPSDLHHSLHQRQMIEVETGVSKA